MHRYLSSSTPNLVVSCAHQSCDFCQDAEPADACVHVTENKFGAKEKTIVLEDVISDPTLPRTKDVRCPKCNHNEAVFISSNTEQGMTLFFTCVSCTNKWRDYV